MCTVHTSLGSFSWMKARQAISKKFKGAGDDDNGCEDTKHQTHVAFVPNIFGLLFSTIHCSITEVIKQKQKANPTE